MPAANSQTMTNALGETTTYAYDTDGRLQSVGGTLNAATTLTYDAYGRVRTVTDSDGDTVTTDYDAFDRPVRRTYPDARRAGRRCTIDSMLPGASAMV